MGFLCNAEWTEQEEPMRFLFNYYGPWSIPKEPIGFLFVTVHGVREEPIGLNFLVVRGRCQRNQGDFSLLRSMDITKESNGIFLCYSPCTVAGETIVTLHQLFKKCYNWFLFVTP